MDNTTNSGIALTNPDHVDIDDTSWHPVLSMQEAKRNIGALAKQFCRPAFLEIVRIAKTSPDQRLRFLAAQYICDRAWGRPHQSVDMTGTVDIRHTIDAPPRETREEWLERKRREREDKLDHPKTNGASNGHAN